MQIVVCTTCSGSNWPCGKAEETTRCYGNTGRNVSEYECSPQCSNGNHYVENNTTGICDLRPCHLRTKNSSANYPCGEECWWDMPNGNACINSSTNCISDDYEKVNLNYTCWKKCTKRTETTDSTWPCGDNNENTKCYANSGRNTGDASDTQCAMGCSNTDHYVVDPATGICVVKPCQERTKNSSANHPCGLDCWWDQWNSNVCVNVTTACTNSDMYEKMNINNTCWLKCAYRTNNGSATWPCGSESEETKCYANTGRNMLQTQCASTCSYEEHFEPSSSDSSAGKCVLKSCTLRSNNGSDTLPCGSTDCYWDMGAGANKCNTDCTNENHYIKKDENRTCEWKSCNLRTSNFSFGNTRCGVDTCYLNMSTETTCTDCNGQTYEKSINTQGQKTCQLRCAYRTADPSNSSFPCGPSANPNTCFWDQGNVDSPYSCFAGCNQVDPDKNECVAGTYNPCTNSNLWKRNGANYTCVLKTCSERKSGVGSGNWRCRPTGSTEECYEDVHRDSTGSIACNTGCTDPHFEVSSTGTGNSGETGKCTAKPCADREKIGDGNWPCGWENEGSKCYTDTNGTTGKECATSCSNSHYKEDSTGYCIPKTCASRPPIDTNTNDACGKDIGEQCYKDTPAAFGGAVKCVNASSCSSPNHYSADYTTGACEEKQCVDRLRNSSVSPQCGSGTCVWDPLIVEDHNCTTACTLPNHYASDSTTKVCTIKECANRVRNYTADLECGLGDCVYDLQVDGDHNCSLGCTLGNHYEANSSHVCVAKDCTQRKRIESESLQCGPDGANGVACYYDAAYENCTEECAVPNHYIGDANHVCVERECEDRMKEEAESVVGGVLIQYPCGSDDCFVDTGNLVNPQRCALNCSNSSYYFIEPLTHQCLPEGCNANRHAIEGTADLPCLSDCFLDTGGTNKCGAICTATDHYIGNETSFRCVLKPCEERTKNESGGGAYCGPAITITVEGDGEGGGQQQHTQECYWDERVVDTVNGKPLKCRSLCEPAEHFYVSEGSKECLPKQCGSRTLNITVDLFCGAECVLNEESECVNSTTPGCTNKAHYTVNSSGVCVIKEVCTMRTVNDSVTPRCGDECVLNEEGICVNSTTPGCTNKAHYTVNSVGVCVIKEVCTDRTVNESVNLRCGAECILNEEGICVGLTPGCKNSAHYEVNSNGVCVGRSCKDRETRDGDFPCGHECVVNELGVCTDHCSIGYDNSSGLGVCEVTCSCLTIVFVKNSSNAPSLCGDTPATACGTLESAISRLCESEDKVKDVLDRAESNEFVIDRKAFDFGDEKILFDGDFDITGSGTTSDLVLNILTNITFEPVSTDTSILLNVGVDSVKFSITAGNITFKKLTIALPTHISGPSTTSTATDIPNALFSVREEALLVLSYVDFLSTHASLTSPSKSEFNTLDYSIVDNSGTLSLANVTVNGNGVLFGKTLFRTNPSFFLSSSIFANITASASQSIDDRASVIHIHNSIPSSSSNPEDSATTSTDDSDNTTISSATISLNSTTFTNIYGVNSAVYSTVSARELSYTLSNLNFTNVHSSANGSAFSHTATGSLRGRVEKLVVELSSFICSAEGNGGALYYAASTCGTAADIDISGVFQKCTVPQATPTLPHVGAAVAVFVQPHTASTVSTVETEYDEGESASFGGDGSFYVGFIDDKCK